MSTNFYLEGACVKLRLKKNQNYYYQMQLALINSDSCDFAVRRTTYVGKCTSHQNNFIQTRMFFPFCLYDQVSRYCTFQHCVLLSYSSNYHFYKNFDISNWPDCVMVFLTRLSLFPGVQM